MRAGIFLHLIRLSDCEGYHSLLEGRPILQQIPPGLVASGIVK